MGDWLKYYHDSMTEKRKIIIVKGFLILNKGMLNNETCWYPMSEEEKQELRKELELSIASAEKWLKEHDNGETQNAT
jgi:hypothetical protein